MNVLRKFINTTFLKNKSYVFDNKWKKRNKNELVEAMFVTPILNSTWIPVYSLETHEIKKALEVLKQNKGR